MKNKLFQLIPTEYMVMFFRTFALILIFITTYLIFIDWEENKSLIGALGILTSALLASYSVILNIDTTIKLKNIENSNKIRFVFFHLCIIKMRLISLNNEKRKEKISYPDLDRILNTIYEINIKLSEINSNDIVSIVHNKVLNDLHFIYLNINTQTTYFKSFSQNIKRPEVGKINGNVLPNPLNTISIRTNDTIDMISNVLTYLREGYEKEFPGQGGIEECSSKYKYSEKSNIPSDNIEK